MNYRAPWATALLYIVSALVVFIAIGPFLVMLATSFKTSSARETRFCLR